MNAYTETKSRRAEWVVAYKKRGKGNEVERSEPLSTKKEAMSLQESIRGDDYLRCWIEMRWADENADG